MSAEAVGRHMPAVATLDDLIAMIAADPHGHRYETSPEGVLSVMPPPVAKRREYAVAGIPHYWIVDRDAASTVTMHRLAGEQYEVRAATPLAWVLNMDAVEHLD